MKKKDLAKKMGPTLKKFYRDFYKEGHAGAALRPSIEEMNARIEAGRKSGGGSSSFKKQSRATRESHQLPSNKKLRPAKKKNNDSDYY